jgi:hypothetical protein
LLVRQAALQAEAASVLADLDLFSVLGRAGRPVQTGSVALGLMVWRDIDVTILCPRLEVATVLEPHCALASHRGVRQVQFRNDTGAWNVDPAYPDGLYLGVDYGTAGGHDWKLDLWFLLEGTTQYDLRHIETLPPRLTPVTRLAILRIKDAWYTRPAYRSQVRSYDIYEAVLDHGVRTPAEFEAHLAARSPKPASG